MNADNVDVQELTRAYIASLGHRALNPIHMQVISSVAEVAGRFTLQSNDESSLGSYFSKAEGELERVLCEVCPGAEFVDYWSLGIDCVSFMEDSIVKRRSVRFRDESSEALANYVEHYDKPFQEHMRQLALSCSNAAERSRLVALTEKHEMLGKDIVRLVLAKKVSTAEGLALWRSWRRGLVHVAHCCGSR